MSVAKLISYEGDNNTFVWKHKSEDFNSLTQLIVHESQEAVFFMNGQALDLFGPGRYTLETENIPKIGAMHKHLTNGDPFHCEVYFVNMATQMAVKWGTDSKVRLLDPATGMYVELGASGEFNIKVIDSRKLLVKIVGTTADLNQQQIMSNDGSKSYFRTMVATQVKSYLAQVIKECNISVLELDAELMKLSEGLRDKINEYLDAYGLYMPEFFVARIVTPDDDPNFARMKEQLAERYLKVKQEEIRKETAVAEGERIAVEASNQARAKIISAQGEAEALKIQKRAEAEAYRAKAEAEAAEMKMKGYTYQQETARQVALEAMQDGLPSGGSGIGGTVSGAVGDIASLGVTLGTLGGVVGMTKDALGGVFDTANQIKDQTQSAVIGNLVNCPSCGKRISKSKFCPECGYKFKAVCPNCGNKLQEGTKFCPECGTKI